MDEKEKKHSTDSKDAERSYVIINGKRVEGINAETDEVVSAGKVYPIYTHCSMPAVFTALVDTRLLIVLTTESRLKAIWMVASKG